MQTDAAGWGGSTISSLMPRLIVGLLAHALLTRLDANHALGIMALPLPLTAEFVTEGTRRFPSCQEAVPYCYSSPVADAVLFQKHGLA